MTLSDVDTWELVGFLQVDMLFHVGGRHGRGWYPGVCELHGWTSIPGKEACGIGCGWVPVPPISCLSPTMSPPCTLTSPILMASLLLRSSVEIFRYSSRMFFCACPTVISSISSKSFHFPFLYFVLFVLRYFPFHVV